MKKRETIVINDRDYNITELTVKEILTLLGSEELSLIFSKISEVAEDNKLSLTTIYALGIGKQINAIMEKCCNFTFDDLQDLTPSEVKEILVNFKKVNEDFFFTLEQMGILQIFQEIKTQMLSSFSKALADLSKQDI